MQYDPLDTEEIRFELAIYATLAGKPIESEDYKILSYPDPNGDFPTDKDREYFTKEAKRNGYKLLYQIKCDNYYVIFEPNNLSRIGLIPVSGSNSFIC